MTNELIAIAPEFTSEIPFEIVSTDDGRAVQHDRKLAKRISQLVQDILRAPFEGIGKPEALKGDLSGYWSRRINDEHRLVYTVKDDAVNDPKASDVPS